MDIVEAGLPEKQGLKQDYKGHVTVKIVGLKRDFQKNKD